MSEGAAATTQSGVERAEGTADPAWLHLRCAGVSVLLRWCTTGLPVVLHWGADLGDLVGLDPESLRAFAPDEGQGSRGRLPSVVPASGGGWASRPGLSGARSGRGSAVTFTEVRAHLISGRPVGPGLSQVEADTLVIEAVDVSGELSLDLAVQLTATGLLRCRAGITNTAAEAYQLDALDLFMPVDDTATHRIEFDPDAGLRTAPLGRGSLVLESFGAESPPAMLIVGEPWTRFRAGGVWQAHVGFSGAVRHRVEQTSAGRTYVGGGELLQPGEIVLRRGESYHSPWVFWTWADGLDAAASRLHEHLRTHATHPTAVRPVVFDASAAAFAQHDRHAMLELAEYAAAIGAETFLLDLNWCIRAGLDPDADLSSARADGGHAETLSGLDDLLGRIRGYELEVGLTIAPELVGPDSYAARDHPEWLIPDDRDGELRRVLDLSVRPAMLHVWERLTKLLDRHPVSLLTWNLEQGAGRDRSGPSLHVRTLAAYRLLDALRERYPQLVVQTANLDLAMGIRAGGTDPSTDAGRRHAEFAALTQLMPPELLWQPVHDEGEDATSATFRAVSGFFGQLGLGLDLNLQTPANLRSIARWLALHTSFRPLLHSGRTVRSDQSDGRLIVHGVVSSQCDEALFAVVWIERSAGGRRIRLDGLDPARRYRLEVVGVRTDTQAVVPGWSSRGAGHGPTISGAALGTVGISVPAARRGSALLVHLSAVELESR